MTPADSPSLFALAMTITSLPCDPLFFPAPSSSFLTRMIDWIDHLPPACTIFSSVERLSFLCLTSSPYPYLIRWPRSVPSNNPSLGVATADFTAAPVLPRWSCFAPVNDDDELVWGVWQVWMKGVGGRERRKVRLIGYVRVIVWSE